MRSQSSLKAGSALDGEAPSDLRSADLVIGTERFIVLSYRSPPAPSLPGLTPAESAVARAASSGLASREIAAHRGCSVFTINNQLASAYRKLGVSSRAELRLLLARLESAPTRARGEDSLR